MLMRGKITMNTDTQPSVVLGTIWFDNMTEYINILKYVHDEMAHNIVKVMYFFIAFIQENNKKLHVILNVCFELPFCAVLSF